MISVGGDPQPLIRPDTSRWRLTSCSGHRWPRRSGLIDAVQAPAMARAPAAATRPRFAIVLAVFLARKKSAPSCRWRPRRQAGSPAVAPDDRPVRRFGPGQGEIGGERGVVGRQAKSGHGRPGRGSGRQSSASSRAEQSASQAPAPLIQSRWRGQVEARRRRQVASASGQVPVPLPSPAGGRPVGLLRRVAPAASLLSSDEDGSDLHVERRLVHGARAAVTRLIGRRRPVEGDRAGRTGGHRRLVDRSRSHHRPGARS